MVMVHAESDGMIKWITSRLLDAELRTPKFHGVARHALAEREATHRAITFAEFVGVCNLLTFATDTQNTSLTNGAVSVRYMFPI